MTKERSEKQELKILELQTGIISSDVRLYIHAPFENIERIVLTGDELYLIPEEGGYAAYELPESMKANKDES